MLEEIEKNQIRSIHHNAIQQIKNALLTKAEQQVADNNSLQKETKAKILKSYNNVIKWMAEQHLSGPQSKKLVTDAQTQLNEKLTDIQNALEDDNSSSSEILTTQAQALQKFTKQLRESLVDFSPSAINTYKAKLSLHHQQLKDKKTDAQLTAKVFDPESFSPDPMKPIDYDYKIDIDNLYLQIKHNLANLKPGEKLNIEVEIPPDRADILKKIAETSFQYKISLLALLLFLFIQFKMINKDDETRAVLAIKKLIEKDQIPLPAEDITFSIKAPGNDGKLRTILKPRPLDPAVAAWKLNKPLQTLNNILYAPVGCKEEKEELEEEKSQPSSVPVMQPSFKKVH